MAAKRPVYNDWRDTISDEHFAKAKDLQKGKKDVQDAINASDALPEGHEKKMEPHIRTAALKRISEIEGKRTRLLEPYKNGTAGKPQEARVQAPVVKQVQVGNKVVDEADADREAKIADFTNRLPQVKGKKGDLVPDNAGAIALHEHYQKAYLEAQATGGLPEGHDPFQVATERRDRIASVEATRKARADELAGKVADARVRNREANATQAAGRQQRREENEGLTNAEIRQKRRDAVAERNNANVDIVQADPEALQVAAAERRDQRHFDFDPKTGTAAEREASTDELRDHALRMADHRKAVKEARAAGTPAPDEPVSPRTAGYTRPADFGERAAKANKEAEEQKVREKAAKQAAVGQPIVDPSTGRVDAAEAAQPRRSSASSTPRSSVTSPTQFGASEEPVAQRQRPARTSSTPGGTNQTAVGEALQRATGVQAPAPAPAENAAPVEATDSATTEARRPASTSNIGTPQQPHRNSLEGRAATERRDAKQRSAVTSMMPNHTADAPLAVPGERWAQNRADAPENVSFAREGRNGAFSSGTKWTGGSPESFADSVGAKPVGYTSSLEDQAAAHDYVTEHTEQRLGRQPTPKELRAIDKRVGREDDKEWLANPDNPDYRKELRVPKEKSAKQAPAPATPATTPPPGTLLKQEDPSTWTKNLGPTTTIDTQVDPKSRKTPQTPAQSGPSLPRNANVQISPVNTTEPTERAPFKHGNPDQMQNIQITNPGRYVPDSDRARKAGLDINPKAMRALKGSKPEGQGTPAPAPAPAAPANADQKPEIKMFGKRGPMSFGQDDPKFPGAMVIPDSKQASGFGVAKAKYPSRDTPGYGATQAPAANPAPVTPVAQTPAPATQQTGEAPKLRRIGTPFGGGRSTPTSMSIPTNKDGSRLSTLKQGEPVPAALGGEKKPRKNSKAAAQASPAPAAPAPSRGSAFSEGSSGWPVVTSQDASKTGRRPQGAEARELAQKGRLDLNLSDRWGASDTPAPAAPAARAGRAARTGGSGGSGGGAPRGTGFSIGDNNSGSNIGNVYNNDNSTHNHIVYGDNYGSNGDMEGGRGAGGGGGGRARATQGSKGPHADIWIKTAHGTTSARDSFRHVTGRTGGRGEDLTERARSSSAAQNSTSHGGQQNDISNSSRVRTNAPDGGASGTGTSFNHKGPEHKTFQSASGNGTANGPQN